MVDTRRITQESVDVQVQLSGDERITQEFVEIIASPANSRITQEWIEIIGDARFGNDIKPVIVVIDSGRTAPAAVIVE